MRPTESAAKDRLTELLQAKATRFEVLLAVSKLGLPDCYVAAGFLRNLAWDHCHGFASTPLNDVDVIYYDASDISPESTEQNIKAQLKTVFPELEWDVKNQARMHVRNHHSLYKNTADAMSYWPEMETAVGVALDDGKFCFAAPFGLGRLFEYSITYNPKREKSLFDTRVAKKCWPDIWPRLKTVYPDG